MGRSVARCGSQAPVGIPFSNYKDLYATFFKRAYCLVLVVLSYVVVKFKFYHWSNFLHIYIILPFITDICLRALNPWI